MTGSNILDFLLAHADKNSNDTEYRSLGLRWLNLVVKDIQSKQVNFHWRFLEVKGATFNTAANDFDYAFSTILPTTLIDTTKTIHVYEKTNDITFSFVPYERFRQMVADESENTGTSAWYSIFANELLLYPVPDSVIAIYIDYIKLMSAVTDSSNVLDIPDKYEKVIIDGLLEYAYQFDTELGSMADQHVKYLEGVDLMIKENGQIIAENVRPVSHRDKYELRHELDGRNSILFPLDNQNM